MFILAKGGQIYARLRFNVGPGSSVRLRVDVDYSHAFPAADHSAWEHEYWTNVAVTDDWFVGPGLPLDEWRNDEEHREARGAVESWEDGVAVAHLLVEEGGIS